MCSAIIGLSKHHSLHLRIITLGIIIKRYYSYYYHYSGLLWICCVFWVDAKLVIIMSMVVVIVPMLAHRMLLVTIQVHRQSNHNVLWSIKIRLTAVWYCWIIPIYQSNYRWVLTWLVASVTQRHIFVFHFYYRWN